MIIIPEFLIFAEVVIPGTTSSAFWKFSLRMPSQLKLAFPSATNLSSNRQFEIRSTVGVKHLSSSFHPKGHEQPRFRTSFFLPNSRLMHQGSAAVTFLPKALPDSTLHLTSAFLTHLHLLFLQTHFLTFGAFFLSLKPSIQELRHSAPCWNLAAPLCLFFPMKQSIFPLGKSHALQEPSDSGDFFIDLAWSRSELDSESSSALRYFCRISDIWAFRATERCWFGKWLKSAFS